MSFNGEANPQTDQADIVAVSGVEEAAQPDEVAEPISASQNDGHRMTKNLKTVTAASKVTTAATVVDFRMAIF
jgi:hypothetical protein